MGSVSLTIWLWALTVGFGVVMGLSIAGFVLALDQIGCPT